MNAEDVEHLSNAVALLRANQFDTVSEAAVFCAAASATARGALSSVTEISRLTRLPITTVSRLIGRMSERGLLGYTTHARDRRVRLVRANLEAFK